MKQFRSANEADRAANKRFVIGAAIIIGIIALLTYTPLFHTDLHAFFAVTKSGTKWLGLVLFAIAFYLVYQAHNVSGGKGSAGYWIAILLIIALAIATACGFDFSYLRLK